MPRAKKPPSPPPVSEKEFQKMIIDLAHLYQWKVIHFRAARTLKGWRTPCEGDAKGFVDLILFHEGRCITLYVECKAEEGKLSPDQLRWRQTLTQARQRYVLWRPSSWPTIQAILAGEES